MPVARIGFLIVALASAQTIETYRARNRLAQELVPFAESALGNEGQVTLDPRTGTLVLNGTPAAIQRALALLERVDRRLRQVVLTHQLRDIVDIDAVGLRVRWRATLGAWRIGNLPLSARAVDVALQGRGTTTRSSSRSVLRLLEGGHGVIATGEAFPFVYQPFWGTQATELVPAETGFEASVQVMPDDRVHLELRPFSGHLEDRGSLRYTSATTTIMAKPGETIVIGEASGNEESSHLSLEGAGSRTRRNEQVLLVSVEVEEP
jgi:type II secretory pathway component HofQ